MTTTLRTADEQLELGPPALGRATGARVVPRGATGALQLLRRFGAGERVASLRRTLSAVRPDRDVRHLGPQALLEEVAACLTQGIVERLIELRDHPEHRP